MKKPGFAGSLTRDLEGVSVEVGKATDHPNGLSYKELVSLTTRPDADPALYLPDHATEKDVSDWSDVTPADELRGEQAIKEGEVAFVVLAGGAATRFGEPKMFARLPSVGLSLLGWKLLQAGNMPTWIMTSPKYTQEIHDHITKLALPTGLNGTIFEQFRGLRLTPDNRISYVNGEPEFYPLGHGDVGPALVENGVLDENPGVKYIYVCNVDNVLGSPHPGIIGRHIRKAGKVTCEVVERLEKDRGGCVAWVNNQLQIAEDFRLPAGFAEEAKYLNTNTMIIDVDVLKWPIPWRWHRVRKQVDGRIVIQYERLIQQYTEECSSEFLAVPRSARYCPIKEPEDLDRASQVLESYRFR